MKGSVQTIVRSESGEVLYQGQHIVDDVSRHVPKAPTAHLDEETADVEIVSDAPAPKRARSSSRKK